MGVFGNLRWCGAAPSHWPVSLVGLNSLASGSTTEPAVPTDEQDSAGLKAALLPAVHQRRYYKHSRYSDTVYWLFYD